MFRENREVWLVIILSSIAPTNGQPNYLLGETQKPWNEAKVRCDHGDGFGGTLVLPRSAQENNELLAFVQKNQENPQFIRYWLNASKRTNWMNKKDGGNLQWANWKPGAPSTSSDGSQRCAVIDRITGEWHEQRCTNKRNYVCEQSAASYTYQHPRTFQDAQADCKSQNAVLVLPRNWILNKGLLLFLQHNNLNLGGKGRLWINTIRPGWVDGYGDSLQWTHWADLMPGVVAHSVNMCLVFVANEGEWIEEPCTEFNEFVCDIEEDPRGAQASGGNVLQFPGVMMPVVCGLGCLTVRVL